jgi:ParB-like nuclease family protein
MRRRRSSPAVDLGYAPRDVARMPIMDIHVPPGRRTIDPATVSALAESMSSPIGLQSPIAVRSSPVPLIMEDGEEVWGASILVAGGHRLAAAKQLGWENIAVTIITATERDAELWEIDENLCRAELTDAQRADHTARRKRLYLEMHPETEHGANASPSGQFGHTANPSFVADTAEKTGKSERAVRRAVHRGESIAPDVLQAVQGTPLDKGVALDAIAKMPHEEQRAVVAAGELPRIVEREPEPEIEYKPDPAIDSASALVKADADSALADDRTFDKLAETWRHASPAARARFLDLIRDDAAAAE